MSHKKQKGREGATLVLFIISSLVVSSLAGGVFSGVIQENQDTNQHRNQKKAEAIANAGMAYAVAQLKQDGSMRNAEALSSETAFGGGTFHLSMESVGNTGAQLRSVGTFSGVKAQILLNLPLETADAESGVPNENLLARTHNGTGNLPL